MPARQNAEEQRSISDASPRRRAGAVFGLLAVAALAAGCSQEAGPTVSDAPAQTIAAEFSGGQACIACHAGQHGQWSASHHAMAMAVADAGTVLGDFDNSTYDYNGISTRFFVRDGGYWVSTDGSDGTLADFPVAYTFGIDPLQQYLIEFPDGRYQALSIAWDSRPAADGGQRWFHLYPDESIDSDDALHWTGTYQNWNTMCAECHSTNLDKGFDPAAARFSTSWSSINVDCEACHGPGSLHAASPLDVEAGLPRIDRAWVFVDDAPTARLQAGATQSLEIDVCAQCHARRSQLTDDFLPGDAFLDGFRPTLLDASLYHADGQILGEVYVYGSFLQSRMHAAGVSCSDCHEPHSARLRADGNALCGQCHMPSVFDTPAHHRHAQGSDAAECVNCHMRAETYMVVDPRRDHSFRVPRPDLTSVIGSPNACQDCHADETSAWAAAEIAAWYPEGRAREFHYGQAIHAGRSWSADRGSLLRRVVADPEQPEIVRATAVSLLAEQLDDAAVDLIEQQLEGNDPLVQLAALEALSALPIPLRIDLAQRFLDHETRSLRLAAARVLLGGRDALSESRRSDLDAALGEYLAVQDFASDRAEGLFNIGGVRAEQGRFAEAEAAYRLAIEREPAFTASYINLSDLYRQTGREAESAEILRAGIAAMADDANLMLSLGFSLVRAGDSDEALEWFRRAGDRVDGAPYYHYVLGVALNSLGDRDAALQTLSSAHESFPGYREIIVALATINRDAGETARAIEYARRLSELSPSDETARALLLELGAGSAPTAR